MESYVKTQNDASTEKNFELVHMLGLNCKFKNSVQCHPSMSDTIVYSIGGTVVIEDMLEKNNQVFFKHGNYCVSSFKVSNTGAYLAVGFSRPPLEKSLPAPIILWDFANKQVITELTGIFREVKDLEFSPDDVFLAATGIDCSFFIWDVKQKYKAMSRIFGVPVEFLSWTNWDNTLKYPSYSLVLADSQKVHKMSFFHELKSMQYAASFELLPAQPRGYSAIQTCNTFNNYYFGNKTGEINVFRTNNNLFKASFKVVNGGVTSLLLVDQNTTLVGGGDGRVIKIVNKENEHFLSKEAQLVGAVTSMSLSADRTEVVVTTSVGCIYRIIVADFTFSFYSVANTASVNASCYGRESDKFYVGDSNGMVFCWDVNEFKMDFQITGNREDPVSAIQYGNDDTLVIGYSSGKVKFFTGDGERLIREVEAHKGAVSALYVDSNYLLTGGIDGIIKAWNRDSLTLIIEYFAHKGTVREVKPDINKVNLIYSVGSDKYLFCFDLRLQKQVYIKNLPNGNFLTMDQFKTPEYDMITAGRNCEIAVWDFFKEQPIETFIMDSAVERLTISNNGNFYAMGNEFGEVAVFESSTHQCFGNSQGHSQRVTSVKWSPDDKQLVSTAADNSVVVWNCYFAA